MQDEISNYMIKKLYFSGRYTGFIKEIHDWQDSVFLPAKY